MKNVWRSNTKTWTALCRGRTNVINFRFHSGLGHFLISKAFKYLSKKMTYQYDLYPVAFLTFTFSYHLENYINRYRLAYHNQHVCAFRIVLQPLESNRYVLADPNFKVIIALFE